MLRLSIFELTFQTCLLWLIIITHLVESFCLNGSTTYYILKMKLINNNWFQWIALCMFLLKLQIYSLEMAFYQLHYMLLLYIRYWFFDLWTLLLQCIKSYALWGQISNCSCPAPRVLGLCRKTRLDIFLLNWEYWW